VTNSDEAQKKLLFLPGQLIDGIEQFDDPMINVRNGAYLSCSRAAIPDDIGRGCPPNSPHRFTPIAVPSHLAKILRREPSLTDLRDGFLAPASSEPKCCLALIGLAIS